MGTSGHAQHEGGERGGSVCDLLSGETHERQDRGVVLVEVVCPTDQHG